MTTNNTPGADQMREEFERWAVAFGICAYKDEAGYLDYDTVAAWAAWQAAVAACASEPAKSETQDVLSARDEAQASDDEWENHFKDNEIQPSLEDVADGLYMLKRKGRYFSFKSVPATPAAQAQEPVYQCKFHSCDHWTEVDAGEYEAIKDVTLFDKRILYATPQPAPSATAWQPIESAPKGGARVLIWGPQFAVPVVGAWYGYNLWGPGGYSAGFKYSPTHWMPLPPPPESKE